MQKVIRFGVAMAPGLLGEFDALITRKGYANRSEAIRALIRAALLESGIRERGDSEVIGTITLVYDHGAGDLTRRLTALQHRCHDNIVSTLHVHFDEHNCLEVLVVKGKNSRVRAISDALIGTRGVHHGNLVIDSGMDGLAGHAHPASGTGAKRTAGN
jgi:CopG family nickel-responsive transcriptional regulator